VFRYSQSYLKREREFCQAGVELIGCNTSDADAEILALLVSALKNSGLNDVRIDLGHASLVKDLLNAAGLTKQQKTTIQSLLSCRDSVGLKKFLEQKEFSTELKDVFFELSKCRKLNSVSLVNLDENKYSKINKQIESLTKLQETLKDYKIENMVFFDFSLTQKIEYYTGIVFEASVPNLGFPLGSGGRYDNFIEKFGKIKLPSTGFALEIEKLLQALNAQGFRIPDKTKNMIIVSSKSKTAAVKSVKIFRDAGFIASIEITRRNFEKTIEYAKIINANYVVSIESSLKDPIRVYDIKSETSQKTTIKEFLRTLGVKN
jgi:ATP phosphoribosyltransferase regulatory subunit